MTTICDVDPTLIEKMKKFRFRKEQTNAAFTMKIDKDKLMILEDEAFENVSIEELASELPETQPRYVVYSYRHERDGRVSFPLIFIYYSPTGVKPEMHMMYASSKVNLVQKLDLAGKVFDVRVADEMTLDWLKDKLSFFK